MVGLLVSRLVELLVVPFAVWSVLGSRLSAVVGHSVAVVDCLPACLLACLPARLIACLPISLHAWPQDCAKGAAEPDPERGGLVCWWIGWSVGVVGVR